MIEYTMQVALCDDEPDALSTLRAMVLQAAAQEGFRCDCTLYSSGTDLLNAIRPNTRYHALLLDVMMNDMTGMELAAALRAQKDQTPIVFVSSNRDMAVCGYEVQAARFLTKPVEPDKIREALRLCYETGISRQSIMLLTSRGLRKVSVADIQYVETGGRELRITLTDGVETTAMKLTELTALLPQSQFIMCHRTVLVNLAYVKYLRYCELELKTGGTLPVSKYRQKTVREKLFDYLSG